MRQEHIDVGNQFQQQAHLARGRALEPIHSGIEQELPDFRQLGGLHVGSPACLVADRLEYTGDVVSHARHVDRERRCTQVAAVQRGGKEA